MTDPRNPEAKPRPGEDARPETTQTRHSLETGSETWQGTPLTKCAICLSSIQKLKLIYMQFEAIFAFSEIRK